MEVDERNSKIFRKLTRNTPANQSYLKIFQTDEIITDEWRPQSYGAGIHTFKDTLHVIEWSSELVWFQVPQWNIALLEFVQVIVRITSRLHMHFVPSPAQRSSDQPLHDQQSARHPILLIHSSADVQKAMVVDFHHYSTKQNAHCSFGLDPVAFVDAVRKLHQTRQSHVCISLGTVRTDRESVCDIRHMQMAFWSIGRSLLVFYRQPPLYHRWNTSPSCHR